MGLLKILCFSVLATFLLTISEERQKDCNIMASIKISEELEGLKIITLTPKGGQAPYKYVFYKESGELLSEDFNSNTTKGLEKGKYFCTVVDKLYCKKTIEIEIK